MKFNLSILFFLFHVCLAVFSQDNPYQSHADKLFHSGEYERAFRLYGNAIKADQLEDANYKLFLNAGDCAHFLNYKQIALSYYGLSALRNAPIEELTKHIATYCDNDLSCIPVTLKKIAQKHPETQSYLYPEIATILFNQSEYIMAIPVLKECLNSHPQNLPIQKMLAKSFFNIGNTDSAYVMYKEIVEHNSDDYDSYVFLGNYYYVIANKFMKTATTSDEKRVKSALLRKDDGKMNTDTTTECYHKAGEYLEKAYAIYNSNEIRKSLIEIYTTVGNKDKTALYKKTAKK